MTKPKQWALANAVKQELISGTTGPFTVRSQETGDLYLFSDSIKITDNGISFYCEGKPVANIPINREKNEDRWITNILIFNKIKIDYLE
jgi:hypothetical protein